MKTDNPAAGPSNRQLTFNVRGKMTTLYYMILVHFIADWVFQTRRMGKLKSSHPLWLLFHILIIWVCFLPFGLEFSTWNAGFHAIIDVTLWNLYKIKVVYPKYRQTIKFCPDISRKDAWKMAKNAAKRHRFLVDPWFKWTVGFDQMCHYTTLLWVFERFYQ